MMILIYLQLLVVFTAIDVQSYEYCKDEEKLCYSKNKRHIACDPDQLTDLDVTDHTIIPMTKKLRRIIVDTHNTYRNELACGEIRDKNNETYPQASKMQQVEWDYELEYISRLHALRCKFQHDQCRNTHRFPLSGQNLAILYASENTNLEIVDIIPNQITSWYKEYKVGTIDNIKGKPAEEGVTVGHFTVLVNDKVDKIGCSYNVCYKSRSHQVNHILTCNYAYTNYEGASSYSLGDATSACDDFKKKPSSKYECLCE